MWRKAGLSAFRYCPVRIWCLELLLISQPWKETRAKCHQQHSWKRDKRDPDDTDPPKQLLSLWFQPLLVRSSTVYSKKHFDKLPMAYRIRSAHFCTLKSLSWAHLSEVVTSFPATLISHFCCRKPNCFKPCKVHSWVPDFALAVPSDKHAIF